MIEIKTNNFEETKRVGAELAKSITVGRLLLIDGEMGVGKTVFCRGLYSGFGCIGYFQSPTFAIANVYEGRFIFVHLDLYRICDGRDIEAAGLYDYLDEGAVVAAEWAQNAPELAQVPHIAVNICGKGEKRIITIREKP